jgi:hypothetical protein
MSLSGRQDTWIIKSRESEKEENFVSFPTTKTEFNGCWEIISRRQCRSRSHAIVAEHVMHSNDGDLIDERRPHAKHLSRSVNTPCRRSHITSNTPLHPSPFALKTTLAKLIQHPFRLYFDVVRWSSVPITGH